MRDCPRQSGHAFSRLDGGRLTVSLEKFVIDAEALAMFARFLEGFPINDDELALDMIAEVGPGGHHFGTPHTQERFRTAFYQSSLADRSSFDSWQQAGATDTYQRANKLWKENLRRFEAPALDEGILESINAFVAQRTRH